MAENSKIGWTSHTWNLAVGCKKVDSDCKYCYMYRDSLNSTRFDPKQIVKTKSVFNLPLKIKEPSLIFASSYTDFFLPEIDSFRHEAWDIIRKCPQHKFQILTKRPERIPICLPDFWDEIKDRVWLGTSIGSNEGLKSRLHHLLNLHDLGCILFLSLEPLYEDLDLCLSRVHESGKKYSDILDWVIIGGESGNDNGLYRYRPCELEWIEKLVNECKSNNVAVFVKQLGTYLSKKMNLKKDRHGVDIDNFPESIKFREFPKNK